MVVCPSVCCPLGDSGVQPCRLTSPQNGCDRFQHLCSMEHRRSAQSHPKYVVFNKVGDRAKHVVKSAGGLHSDLQVGCTVDLSDSSSRHHRASFLTDASIATYCALK